MPRSAVTQTLHARGGLLAGLHAELARSARFPTPAEITAKVSGPLEFAVASCRG
jgi:hypothetical protein